MTGTDRIPEITPEGRLRTNWQTVCAVVGALGIAVSLGTAIYLDVQTLKAQTKSLQETVDSLSRQVDRLNWTLSATPSVTVLPLPHHGGTP